MNVPNRRVREGLRDSEAGRDSIPPIPAPPPETPRPPSRFMSVVRTVLGVALVAGASVTVAWAARRHIMTSPRFAVTEVEVEGADHRSSEAIAAESGILVGTNVFALDLDGARAGILSDPWIAEVSLARRLPGTILVQVVERKAAALLAMGDTFLATGDGEPFKKLESGDPVELPLVTGLKTDSFTTDRDGAMRTVRRAVDLAAEYERGPLARKAPLEEVHVEPDGAFTLVVGRGATELVLGGPPFRRKLEQAARVVAELEKRGAKADTIMLDNDARPERVVVRMR
jgi:cell division protein FtsQ